MAIDTGLAIGCADLQATGGIEQILLKRVGLLLMQLLMVLHQHQQFIAY